MSALNAPRKFRRMPEKKWIAGVCAGFAYFVGIEVWIVRMFWILCLFASGGFAIVLYVLFLVVPRWNETPPDFDEITGD